MMKQMRTITNPYQHMRKILIIFSLILLLSTIDAQETHITKNGINYEFYGTGYGEISMNYERFVPLNATIYMTIGTGIAFSSYVTTPKPIELGPFQILIPLQINLLFGKQVHKLEVGYGIPVVLREDFPEKSVFIHVFRIGYRYHPQYSKLYFRASLNPSIIVDSPKLIGGLGIGYSF